MIVDYLIGTYTWRDAEGIYRGRLDTETGEFTCDGLAARTTSPAFLVDHDDFVYAVNETHDGSMTAFRREGSSLRAINTVASGGALPCHLDVVGASVVVANYSSGSVASFAIRPDGALGPCVSRFFHPGSGPVEGRQERAHAHQVLPRANDRIWVPDLGADRVFEYRVVDNHLRSRRVALDLPAGSGPRHIAASSAHAYVLGELGNTIDVIDLASETIVQNISTLPDDFDGESFTAEILLTNTATLLATNRGHNSIVSFSIAEDGTLSTPEFVPTLGDHPRFMTLDPSESYALVLNQNDDNVVVYKLENGRPTTVASNTYAPTPVCLLAL